MNVFFRPTIAFFGLISVGLLLLSCTDGSSNSESKNRSVRVAFLGSLTGNTAGFSKSTLQGVQLAFEEESNEDPTVELIVKDSTGRAEEAVKKMQEIAADESVIAVLGEISSAMSLAVAPIAQREQIPMVTPTSTNPRVTEIGNYIFRICFIDPFQGFVMAKFAKEHLDVDKVAVLKDSQSDYSKGLAEFFKETFKNLDGKIVMDEVYGSGDRDFKVQLEQIRKSGAEAIFLPGYYREVALIARQARKMGIDAHLLGGDGWDSDRLFDIGRDAINGGYFSNHFTTESKDEAAQEFMRKFREKYKKNPDGLAARGYDAAKILLHAIQNSKKLDRAFVREQLAIIKDFPGATGKTTINNKRNAQKPAVVLKVDGPVNRYVTTVAP